MATKKGKTKTSSSSRRALSLLRSTRASKSPSGRLSTRNAKSHPRSRKSAERVPRLILASQSPARRKLLSRLGVKFSVKPTYLDEEALGKGIRDPYDLVLVLARAKAQTVHRAYSESVIIGSDQMLILGKKAFGKPGSEGKARAQLAKFAGNEIKLLTGVSIIAPEGETSFVHETRMKFRKLTKQEIADYVERDQPIEVAGSFKFESYGISLFESVETDDPSAIEGLPILQVGEILRRILPASAFRA